MSKQFHPHQPVTIHGDRWVITEHKPGESAVWARRDGEVTGLSVCHRAEDVRAVEAEPTVIPAADVERVREYARKLRHAEAEREQVQCATAAQ
jgi:hypothetical protein